MCTKKPNKYKTTCIINKIIESYYHRIYHIFVYNILHEVFILKIIIIIHAFSRIFTVVFRFLCNLPMNLNVTVSKLRMP